jgi:hypothetical protein
MKKIGLAVLALLVLSPAAPGQQIVREWQAQAALDVDAAGQVVAVAFPDTIPETLAKPAREVMGHWRFKPAEAGGHAVGAKTWANVSLQVVKRDPAGFSLMVVYKSNGPRLRPTVAPVPPGAGDTAGALLVEAVVRPDGHLDQVKVVESHFASRDHLFVQAAEQGVRQWLGDPEYVDGRPVATRVQIPVMVCAPAACERYASQLKLWHRPGHAALSTPTPGESVALNSALEPVSVQPGG